MLTAFLLPSKKLKGHQIIGELRHLNRYLIALPWIERSPDHWWVTTRLMPKKLIELHWKVTRSLVSYDSPRCMDDCFATLKGHQIIGELRQNFVKEKVKGINWKVTRSLVSYDLKTLLILPMWNNWKVTRSLVSYDRNEVPVVENIVLKGHQIIGELRQLSCEGHKCL